MLKFVPRTSCKIVQGTNASLGILMSATIPNTTGSTIAITYYVLIKLLKEFVNLLPHSAPMI